MMPDAIYGEPRLAAPYGALNPRGLERCSLRTAMPEIIAVAG